MGQQGDGEERAKHFKIRMMSFMDDPDVLREGSPVRSALLLGKFFRRSYSSLPSG